MRRIKRALAVGLTVVAILGIATVADASEKSKSEAVESATESTEKATKKPKATATPEPTATAKATKKRKATATPEPAATAKASKKAKATATPEPAATAKASKKAKATAMPEPTATSEPAATAKATKKLKATVTPEPTAEPTEAPATTQEAKANLTVSVKKPKNLSVVQNAYIVNASEVSSITLQWTSDTACDSYTVKVKNQDSKTVLNQSTSKAAMKLSLADLTAGKYTVTVIAVANDASIGKAKLVFRLVDDGEAESPADQEETPETDPEGDEQAPGEMPEGERPSRGGGSWSGGSRNRSSSRSGGSAQGGGEAAADQGFSITPGQALIYTHASGDRSTRLYGTVELTAAEAPMTLLTLGEDTLDISLEGGGAFTAAIDESTLVLSPVEAGDAWLLNGYALKTLSESGIDSLRLPVGEVTFDLPTRLDLTGSAYARLCAEGFVSHDYTFALRDDGLWATVDGTTYRLSEGGELIDENAL